MKHTPKYLVKSTAVANCVMLVSGDSADGSDRCIAQCGPLEDAAFIVQACNAHKELVSVARTAVDALTRRGQGQDYYTVALRQAIAKVKEVK